jgi:hypothetical protein
MMDIRMPGDVYRKENGIVFFNQLALKIEMDTVDNPLYFGWLDRMKAELPVLVKGAQIAEKEHARVSPPLNTAVYYDTDDHAILPTGALLRTSCNKITHAFCAFKMAEDEHSVRSDHRFVFEGDEKREIQRDPTSPEAVAIVTRLLARRDIMHPGIYLEEHLAIPATSLRPAVCLESHRFTFFVWLDKRDALRCSVDRYRVSDLRLPECARHKRDISEVELAVYPRIAADVASDQRTLDCMNALAESLCNSFGVRVTREIKYQRACKALGIRATQPS